MVKSGSAEKCSTKVVVILALCVQFCLLFHLNYFNWDNSNSSVMLTQKIAAYEDQIGRDKEVIRGLETAIAELNHEKLKVSEKLTYSEAKLAQESSLHAVEGIALLLMTDQPKWFQRRYSLLIQNLLSNLPTTWKVQIFHPDSKQFHAGVNLNPGFKRLIDSNYSRLHLTKLPPKLVKARKRPIHLMLHPFVWENTLAEKVLYLDGNHVLCANSPFRIQDFLQFDYIGAPGWGNFKGQAGGGGISLRNSTLMKHLILQELSSLPEQERVNAHEKWGRDDEFFVSRMIKQNKLSVQNGMPVPYVFADKKVQQQFSSSRSVANFEAFAVSGTLPGISWDDRNEVINYCPELKTIFPSLHEPGCFGADVSKTRDKCAASICALNPEKKSC
mmetsp:Transcript_8144/g.13826  ORF Transcript_8144/g.13826 Transcript_8144/m.13826 type:complete len:387 (-) Transcript_8144:206-1366(-)